jgi:hypothetical protein
MPASWGVTAAELLAFVQKSDRTMAFHAGHVFSPSAMAAAAAANAPPAADKAEGGARSSAGSGAAASEDADSAASRERAARCVRLSFAHYDEKVLAATGERLGQILTRVHDAVLSNASCAVQ